MLNDLQTALDTFAKELGVPGAAVGVLDGDSEYIVTTGVANARTGAPVTPETLFHIGSTSKTFTGTVAMRLIQDGKLGLDTFVSEILPEFRLSDDEALAKLKIRHLLTHSGGFRGDADGLNSYDHDALEQAMSVFVDIPQYFEPGTVFSYSNSGIRVLSRVCEVVSGTQFMDLVRELVFEPLGMETSFYRARDAITYPLAVGHVVTDGEAAPSPFWEMPYEFAGEGGIVSTVGDQLRYARFQMRGESAGEQPVSDETRALMQQPQLPAAPPIENVGFPWLLTHFGRARMVQHGGNISNLLLSEFQMAPDEDFAITVLTNSEKGKALGAKIVAWALEHFRDITVEPVAIEPADDELVDRILGFYNAGQFGFTLSRGPEGITSAMRFSAELDAVNPDPAVVQIGADSVLYTPDGKPIGRVMYGDDGKPAFLHMGMRAAVRED